QLMTDNIGEFPIIRGRMKSTDFSTSSVVILPGTNKTKMYSTNRYNLLRTESAINFMISKKFIDSMNLRFSEQFKTYSDLTFMILTRLFTSEEEGMIQSTILLLGSLL